MKNDCNGGKIGFVILLCAATVIGTPAQTFTTLLNFTGTNGSAPYYMTLVQGSDGNFYGTTAASDGPAAGTVFQITPGGTLTTLHSFVWTDGGSPYSGLALAINGTFYGTTFSGGLNNYGTVFEITPKGTLTTLHSFDFTTDGANLWAGLIQATNGSFYGTTEYGGTYTYGTIFKITASGTLTTVHTFNGTDGGYPYASLIQATNGYLYGTTSFGGSGGYGTIFKVTPTGTLTTVHNFDGTDGQLAEAPLVQATNGAFYGTTVYGSSHGAGTIFRITPGGTLTTLYSFSGTDGRYPYAGLIQATDGNLYGTTVNGGTSSNCSVTGCGTIFKITPRGTLTTLHSFEFTDGENPYGALLQATDGNLYGTTYLGGSSGRGTMYSLSVGLAPFLKTLPTFGKVGATVKILGTNLTSASSVTFSGTPATFKVVSPSLITTTVPSGATTGKLQVTTPSGTLSSNVPFRVLP